MLSIMSLLSELRSDTRLAKLSPALSLGFGFGITILIYQISVGFIVFSGPLRPFALEGVRMALFGGLSVCLVVALIGGFRGAISDTLASSAIVMSAIGTTMTVKGSALLPTMTATLIVGVAATGLCLLLVGRLRLSNLLRFIPYSVAGGYLAGTGGTLCLGSVSTMGVNLDGQELSSLLEPASLWSWCPGLAYGLGLLLRHETLENPLHSSGELLARRHALQCGSDLLRHLPGRSRSGGPVHCNCDGKEGRCLLPSTSALWRRWTGLPWPHKFRTF